MKMAAQSHTAGELPLEELLALYGYTVSDPEKETCHMAASLPDMTLDKDQITEDLFPVEEEEESSADDITPSVTSNTSDLLRRLQGGDKDTLVSSSDEDSDDASIPSTEEHKEIMVGSMYQAKIPPISPYTHQERAYSSEDQLLWTPGVLPMEEVEEFLLNVQTTRGQEGAVFTQGATVQDNEQALYELVKCNFNAEEALRRFRFNVKVFSEELCSWSEEECRNFEHGYRVYGKNFHLIQANKVRTRSVGECVEYYYVWKKSDRHVYFTQQATRLSRKKYSLQSGSMEDGDQDGEAGDLEGSNSSSGLLSHTSMGTGQLESTLPPQSNLDLDKQDGELVMGLSELCGDDCPQQLFGCPFSLPPIHDLRDSGSDSCCPSAPVQLQSQPSAQASQWSSPSHHDDHGLPNPCFYQLHMRGGPFVSEGPDCGTAGGEAGAPHRLQVEFSLPSASPPSSAVLPSHFQAFGSLLHPSPVQHPRSLTQ
ncbi:mesoderm induction early response protein 2 [Amphiprion ocellaris]|uniref:Mesoderm induction early response 1, family member 2 n=2 Tax=Amphiprion TaxID=80969 RepID=A0AAQ6AKU4_AMPOC|nr:mesoderm induction early response protein 2 [Amphiprion ocellaris]XP_035807637.1 mesoderm induction early response protein 2 [Amphiprion ocellaris]